MQGQWLGRLDGTSPGLAVVDIDDEGSHYCGHALYFPDDDRLPGTVVAFRTPDKSDIFALEGVDIRPLDRTGLVILPEALKDLFPEALHSEFADISFELREDGLDVSYSTKFDMPGEGPFETVGRGRLTRPDPEAPSEAPIITQIDCWDAFKSHAARPGEPYQYVFRGQPCLNRLRTTFHRTRRSDLVRYVEKDVWLAHRHLTPLTKHLFNLGDPQQTGAFYNLMQHHGYPTPLLDWTYSPFIAAFFAFRAKPPPETQKVRIYVLDKNGWSNVRQFDRLTYLPPHFSVVELLGVENQRMIPQQALSAVTNIDDMETFIRLQEGIHNRVFLNAIDLPVSEREAVLHDLSLMGITAASLFPGLDGSCEALKGRMFGY
jgi:hypothetical protein